MRKHQEVGQCAGVVPQIYEDSSTRFIFAFLFVEGLIGSSERITIQEMERVSSVFGWEIALLYLSRFEFIY